MFLKNENASEVRAKHTTVNLLCCVIKPLHFGNTPVILFPGRLSSDLLILLF